jgi:hypothetical protein
MDAARQVVRFSIPGSVLVLFGLLLYIIMRACQGVPGDQTLERLTENVAPLAGVLATIPIGFVIYQLYYATYGPIIRLLPWRWDGRLVRLDRGSQVLRQLPKRQQRALGDIFGRSLDLSKPYARVPPSGRWHLVRRLQRQLRLLRLTDEWEQRYPDLGRREKAYAKRWHENWDVLRSALDIAGSRPETAAFKHEYTTLSDLYHALGAAKTAASVAFWGVVVLNVIHPGRIADNLLGSIGGFVAISVLTVALVAVLHRTRRRTWKSASASLVISLRWLLSNQPDLFLPPVTSTAVDGGIHAEDPNHRTRQLMTGKKRRFKDFGHTIKDAAESAASAATSAVDRLLGDDHAHDEHSDHDRERAADTPENDSGGDSAPGDSSDDK